MDGHKNAKFMRVMTSGNKILEGVREKNLQLFPQHI